MAANVGIAVQATVSRGVDYLVASRTDTAKARRAQQVGTPVISYPDFFRIIHDRHSQRQATRSPMTGDHDIDDQAAGRVRPIDGPNGGRMAGRRTILEQQKAEARRMADAGFNVTKSEPEKTQPRPHRVLDL